MSRCFCSWSIVGWFDCNQSRTVDALISRAPSNPHRSNKFIKVEGWWLMAHHPRSLSFSQQRRKLTPFNERCTRVVRHDSCPAVNVGRATFAKSLILNVFQLTVDPQILKTKVEVMCDPFQPPNKICFATVGIHKNSSGIYWPPPSLFGHEVIRSTRS